MTSELIGLKLRLRAARQRAAYWSGRPSFRGFGFRTGSSGRPPHGRHDIEYEIAMDDIQSLCQRIGELTGCEPKVSDPREDFLKQYLKLIVKGAAGLDCTENLQNL